ncbi:MAG TPA: acylneuraminate cytidylyltransferase family protein [Polyangiaceae bacterium]|nr:acylneuraminate cytidylyltransferase family protein [Polyangiaceae bacterium]
MIAALIPARGGSKRLPRKNVLPFAGVPLIVHSIAAARAVGRIDRILVSTDDTEIAEIAAQACGEVIVRPAELAHDHATTGSAVRHALGVAYAGRVLPTCVVTLQPNCPLRPAQLVADAIELFLAKAPDSVVSVTSSHRKHGTIDDGLFVPEYRTGMRSQDMQPRYYENGVVYVSRSNLVMAREDLFGERILPLITDPLYALGDIDTALDFQVAEYLYHAHSERFEHAAETLIERIRRIAKIEEMA